jgi:hypothetical protein
VERKTNRIGAGEIAFLFAALAIPIALAELGARVWVVWKWPAEKVHQLTHTTPTRGRFTGHPQLPYALTPGYTSPRRSHNGHGFRGPELGESPPSGAIRIALLGASTVYGARVDDENTSARNLERTLAPRLAPHTLEVVNAGVPGWTTAETVLNLEARVLPLSPDAVVILDGRNEVFPQVFRGYRDDYRHFRDPGFDFSGSHAGHKRVFRLSHLALLLATAGEGRFGFRMEHENPIYATIRWKNQPRPAEAVENSTLPGRTGGLRRNLERIVEIAHSRDVLVALATMPFRAEAFASGVLPRDPDLLPALDALVARNNAVVREVAAQRGALLVDAAPELSTPALLADDCHFNDEGERAFAALVAAALEAPLRAREQAR